jgi:hypothetical protein
MFMPFRYLLKSIDPGFLAVVGLGDTCSEPPPWHAPTGTWVNASQGPAPLGKDATTPADIDFVMVISSAVPLDRTPLPVTGRICVTDRSNLGVGGTYTLDPAASTWGGADYGGARLDLVARRADGASMTIDQAHMANASPTQLSNAIISFQVSTSASPSVFRFEDLRIDAAAACDPAVIP